MPQARWTLRPRIGVGVQALIGLAMGTVALAEQAKPAARTPREAPELVIRALVKAMYANDVAAYERLTVPDPRRGQLTKGGSTNRDRLRELDEDPQALQIRMARPFKHAGKAVDPDARGDYPIGTTVRYVAAHRGGPMTVSLVKQADGWKVDLRWWLAMMDLAARSTPPRPGSPDFAARAFTAALVALDREEAARLALPGADLNLLFAGAPSRREPSGHLDALVFEMPLVEIGPGEFFEMPSGRVVEGSREHDRKVLVGLVGSVEIPFVLRLIGADWRVETEPYFTVLMQ